MANISGKNLENLARMVSGMADATDAETPILGRIAEGQRNYLQLAEQLLTRRDGL